jgi:hypothetical protein
MGLAAVMLVAWPYVFPSGNADPLIAEVNAAYRAVPGFASTIRYESGKLQPWTRMTRLETGNVVGFTEDFRRDRKKGLIGVATAAGVWVTFKGKGCWVASGRGVGGRHFGAPIIPTEGVTFDPPRRDDTGVTLVAHETVTEQAHGKPVPVQFRTEYLIDPDDLRITTITRSSVGGPQLGIAGVNTTLETLTPLSTAPEVVPPTKVC